MNLKWKQTLVRLRLHTVKLSVLQLRLKVNSHANLVDADNSDTFGLNSLQTKKVKALNLKTASSAVLFHVNTSRLFKLDWKIPLTEVFLLDIR
ncbi:Uncharacterised protein [Mycobacteroides abscessus subsp. abscessus]|nr:Uncharacterised protein [Mycobacteroides abscessus subsp. abscessus]